MPGWSPHAFLLMVLYPQMTTGLRVGMQRWWLPQRVPVEQCLCSLVDGARRARRAAPSGASAGLMGLAVGSFCCAAAATKMRASPVWLPQLLRVALAVIALCGFVRLFSKHIGQIMQQRPLRIVIAYVAATAISSAAVTVAAVIAVATAARMYFRAAVDYGTRNEPQRWFTLGVELLERGALLLQMILMTQWVFGEFRCVYVCLYVCVCGLGCCHALSHCLYTHSLSHTHVSVSLSVCVSLSLSLSLSLSMSVYVYVSVFASVSVHMYVRGCVALGLLSRSLTLPVHTHVLYLAPAPSPSFSGPTMAIARRHTAVWSV